MRGVASFNVLCVLVIYPPGLGPTAEVEEEDEEEEDSEDELVEDVADKASNISRRYFRACQWVAWWCTVRWQ